MTNCGRDLENATAELEKAGEIETNMLQEKIK